MPSNHQEEAASYGGQSFKPFEFDETVEPDFADGEYTAIIENATTRMSNPDKDTGVRYPQVVLDWKAEETSEESEACQRSVGNTTREFLSLRPKGDRAGNLHKQRITMLRNRFGIESDVIPSPLSSLADLDDLCAALKGQRTRVVASSAIRGGQLRTNLEIIMEGEVGEETEEASVPKAKPAKSAKAAAPPRKAARR
jgi:hypothetical protein